MLKHSPRQTLHYPLSAALTLLVYILDDPKDPQARPDAHLIKHYGHQITSMHNSGDFDLSPLLKAWHTLEHIANTAVEYPENEQPQDHLIASGTASTSDINTAHVSNPTHLHDIKTHHLPTHSSDQDPQNPPKLHHPPDISRTRAINQPTESRHPSHRVHGRHPRGIFNGRE